MMVLITGVTTLIYRYSAGYMYQDRGYRRYLGLLGLFPRPRCCCVWSPVRDLVMLFVFLANSPGSCSFWHIITARRHAQRRQHLHHVAVERCRLPRRHCLAYSLYGTFEFQTLFTRAAETPITLFIWPEFGWEMNGC
ncbi:MAG: hypothetical protein MRJ92_13365 [Nitrospira sp.]|nr:hypothetical protein [Nitrospira sp.]